MKEIKKEIIKSADVIKLNDLKDAYEQVKKEVGFNNVEIYNLYKKYCLSHGKINLETFKEYLKNLSSKGDIIFSFGDESLSSKEIKKAGVMFRGKLNLLIRFK